MLTNFLVALQLVRPGRAAPSGAELDELLSCIGAGIHCMYHMYKVHRTDELADDSSAINIAAETTTHKCE